MSQPRRYDHPLPLAIAVRDPSIHWPTVRTPHPLAVSIKAATDALERFNDVFRKFGTEVQRASVQVSQTLADGTLIYDEAYWRRKP